MFEFLKKLLIADLPSEGERYSGSGARPAPPVIEAGRVYKGRVGFVGPTFAKIESDHFVAFMPISEISTLRIESASEVALPTTSKLREAYFRPSTTVW